MNDNLSFFDEDFSEGQKHSAEISRIDVVKMQFLEAQPMSWQELFSGFNHLYAITYSSGISFACDLIKKFDTAEIIFGNDEVMTYQMQEIMAYQLKTIEFLREHAKKYKIDLIIQINDGNLHLWVARKQLSHEKLYLLEADDGRKRVVMGSANMSRIAFSGKQRECISYMDGDTAFEWYKSTFEDLKETCTDNISVKALQGADDGEGIDEIPIAQTVKVRKAMVIDVGNDSQDEVNFALDVHSLAKRLKAIVPRPGKDGKIALDPGRVSALRRQAVIAKKQEKELQEKRPQMTIDLERKRAILNGKDLDLRPSTEDVKKDVCLFFDYMAGYEKFHGDFMSMQACYYKFANWFFCSPFMAQMRDMAIRHNQTSLPYPVFGLIYGQSKAGKTSFLETLLKMMIGQKPKLMASEFTRSSIEALKHTVQGVPIVVDDLTQSRFNQHAVETIKSDDFGINEHLTSYPAVVISANEDVKAVSQEIMRRTVICRVEAGLTNTEVMKSNVVRKVQKNIGTAFYREYLRRMIDVVPDLLESLKNEEESAPDILEQSSRIICGIFRESAADKMPPYMIPLTLENYFGEKETGAFAIQCIKTAWDADRRAFRVEKKKISCSTTLAKLTTQKGF